MSVSSVKAAMPSAKRMAKAGISLAWLAANWPLKAFNNNPRLVILYYHACRENSVARFRQQMEVLRAYADVVPADFCGASKGRPKVAITFDDAFVSVIENALPVLADFNFPCTIFVPSGKLGGQPDWQMEGLAPDRQERVATAATLRALDPGRVKLGAHSRTHPHLAKIPEQQARDEIAGSRADLEELLGRPVDLFAFPYGDYSERVSQICREAGYRFVYSIDPRSVATNSSAILRSRVSVDPDDSLVEFWLKIRSAYEWMPAASALKRRLLPRIERSAP
jgi:peptidoglycan/xylan/chitin deacetylase (PgdA/CDA1 family)